MKHWQEAERILDRLLGLAAEGRRAALAVVVAIEGSAYRRPGARLLIEEDGAGLGAISGGCLEEDVRLVGREVLRSGTPRLRHYETGSDDSKVWGLGLGCNGTVNVFVQPGADLATWSRVRDHLRGDTPFTLNTVIDGPGAGEVELLDGAGGPRESRVHTRAQRVFREAFAPPPRLLICGAGDDAIPLAAIRGRVGFRVAVADHRPAYLAAERFPAARALVRRRPEEGVDALALGPDTFAVIMTHSFEARSRMGIARSWRAGVRYLGLLGPRARTERDPGRGQRERAGPRLRAGRASTWGPTGRSRWR